ncbi:MAG: type II toxin-antitoxin system VapC family toxin [Steroidobacteraceae bacterium]
MNFVLDASVTMSWLLSDAEPSKRQYAAGLLESLKRGVTAMVPVTWALEVANVLARGEARGRVSEAQINAFIEMLAGAPIEADASSFSQALGDTLDLARRYRLSSYDASYLELALRMALPIATLDEDLRKAAQKAGVRRFEPK